MLEGKLTPIHGPLKCAVVNAQLPQIGKAAGKRPIPEAQVFSVEHFRHALELGDCIGPITNRSRTLGGNVE